MINPNIYLRPPHDRNLGISIFEAAQEAQAKTPHPGAAIVAAQRAQSQAEAAQAKAELVQAAEAGLLKAPGTSMLPSWLPWWALLGGIGVTGYFIYRWLK